MTTPASEAIARARVRALVRDGLFSGDSAKDDMTIVRRIEYRNSFLPAIDLTFRPLLSGTDVEMRARVHWSTSLFMLLWCGVLLGAVVFQLWTLAQGRTIEPRQLWVPAGMLLFGYALTMGGFLFEARRARELLAERLAPPPSAEERSEHGDVRSETGRRDSRHAAG